jgi:hypothetical protein
MTAWATGLPLAASKVRAGEPQSSHPLLRASDASMKEGGIEERGPL